MTGQELVTFKGHSVYVYSVAFSPDGNRVASGSTDQMVKIWDSYTGRELLTLKGHTGGVDTLAFSPNGQYLISGSDDGTASIWVAATGRPIGEPLVHHGSITAVAFDPSGSRVATASEGGTVRVWENLTGRPLTEPLRHQAAVVCLKFSHDGKSLFSGSRDHTVRVWDLNAPVGRAGRHVLAAFARAISPIELQTSGRVATRVMAPLSEPTSKNEITDTGARQLRQWFLAPPAQRPLTPFAAINLADYIDHCRRDGSAAAAEEAAFYQNSD